MSFHKYLNIQPEIQEAINSGKPLVALESTIIAHGMPYPENVRTALEVEAIVTKYGAVPATIAILDGKICIGLNKIQLEYLATAKNVWKVSLRDMPYVISTKLPGATTVAATMRIASLVGIKIFVTGGIGGVHRGAEMNMDISTDLTEMSNTSVAVVSAGVKSILDIGLTLEYLETKGIPVVTYGQEDFPGFYSRQSGFISPLRLDSADAISDLLKVKWELGLNGSVLIANPIPAIFEVPHLQMEKYIMEALIEAKTHRVAGKKLTPFLLKYVAGKTGGKSLSSNIALIKNNAKLGAEIACSLSN